MQERYFRTVFLNEAVEFLAQFSLRTKKCICTKIAKAERIKDLALFKKLKEDILELRFWYGFMQIRLLAFYDKADAENTLMLVTHGFIKKTDNVPGREIAHAIDLRDKYFENKNCFYG